MNVMSKGLLLLLMISHLSLSFVYAKNALHMFQQNRYEFQRYTEWLFNKKNIKPNIAFIYIVVLLILKLVFKKTGWIIAIFLTIVFAIYLVYQETKKKYIKPLVYTARVKRQIVIYTILLVLATLVVVRYCDPKG